MPNPTMEHLVIDGTTYDIVDSTSGYTSNVGTVTGISMNGSTISPSGGIVPLGTVITTIPEAHSLSYTYGGTGTDPGLTNVGAMLDSHQDLLTETVAGSGTYNFLPKWNTSTELTNSRFYEPSSTYGYFLRDDGNWRNPYQLEYGYPASYTAIMQGDGNFVIYDNSLGSAIWNTSDTITRESKEDTSPTRLYTTSAASTINSGTTSWTALRSDITFPYAGWYLVTIYQYVNISATSGRVGIRMTDYNSYNYTAYLPHGAVNGGGTISLSFIGRFAADTNYTLSAYNSTNVNWGVSRDLAVSCMNIQYLHKNS